MSGGKSFRSARQRKCAITTGNDAFVRLLQDPE